ncbi:MAG: hypothetical protein A3I66_05715 [Burkholderiales bacterium RIFCSPLOWO2_02_FULL_57_36]|nr:MAG: hypothetical protein A3I66_05715 [Burkholderiales bacterium RIFCSPLOWO2_02_FULL_57_36]
MLLRNEQQLALNQVETLCIESADRYEAAAGTADDPALARLFGDLARQRRQFAVELAGHIRALDDLPQQPDPDRETVDELLAGIRAFFSGDQRDALIDERKKLEQDLAEAAQAGLQQPLAEETKILLKQLLSHVDSALRQLEAAQR